MSGGNGSVRVAEARTEPEADAAMAALDDPELVALARQDVAGAFREIMRRNNQRLFRVARGVLRDDAEAEDAVQEAYVRAFQGLVGFRGEARLSTWLTRIAYNEALGRMRRRRATVELGLVDAAARESGGARILMFPRALQQGGTDPEDVLVRSQFRRLLEEAIDTLPGRFRVVLIARDVDGMSVEATAKMLGLRQITVRTRLHRARRLLRAALETGVGGPLRGTFSFDGPRCARLTEGVMARLGLFEGLPQD